MTAGRRFWSNQTLGLVLSEGASRRDKCNSEFEITFTGAYEFPRGPKIWRNTASSMELDIAHDEDTENLYSFSTGGTQKWGAFTMDLVGLVTRDQSKSRGPDATFETPVATNVQAPVQLDFSKYVCGVSPEKRAFVQNPVSCNLSGLSYKTRDIIENTNINTALTLLPWSSASPPPILPDDLTNVRPNFRTTAVNRCRNLYCVRDCAYRAVVGAWCIGTDGRYSIPMIAWMARQYGLGWMVATDHGGRQHSKLNFGQSDPALQRARKEVPEVIQFYGMEFDTPGADHSSMIIPNSDVERTTLRDIESHFSKRNSFPRDSTRDSEPKMLEALAYMRGVQAPSGVRGEAP